MVIFHKRNIFALLVLLASVNLSANGIGFWCDTDKYDCDRHSSGIAEKNAISALAPATTPFLEDAEEAVNSPEVIGGPDQKGWDPIDPPEVIDALGRDGAPTPAPGSGDDRNFPILPFVAIAAGGGFLISLFFYLRRRQGPSESTEGGEESAVEVDEPDVTP